MTVRELIHKLSLYPPDCLVVIHGTKGPEVVEQVVQEAVNAVVLRVESNLMDPTYESDGVTPRKKS